VVEIDAAPVQDWVPDERNHSWGAPSTAEEKIWEKLKTKNHLHVVEKGKKVKGKEDAPRVPPSSEDVKLVKRTERQWSVPVREEETLRRRKGGHQR